MDGLINTQCALLLLLAVTTPVLPADDPMPAAAAVIAAIDLYNSHSPRGVPELDPDDIARLVNGRSLVAYWNEPGEAEAAEATMLGVVGLKVVAYPRLLVWLGLFDSAEPDRRITPATLSNGPAGSYVRYQHINLPWPVRDRHWVIQCEKDIHLAAITSGAIWEHHWTLHPQGRRLLAKARSEGDLAKLTARRLDRSIYLPSNDGAWAMIDLGDGRTLVIAHVNAALGGKLPRGLVRRFTRGQLKSTLRSLPELTRSAYARYDDRQPVHDGWGAPIARGAVAAIGLQTARSSQGR